MINKNREHFCKFCGWKKRKKNKYKFNNYYFKTRLLYVKRKIRALKLGFILNSVNSVEHIYHREKVLKNKSLTLNILK